MVRHFLAFAKINQNLQAAHAMQIDVERQRLVVARQGGLEQGFSVAEITSRTSPSGQTRSSMPARALSVRYWPGGNR